MFEGKHTGQICKIDDRSSQIQFARTSFILHRCLCENPLCISRQVSSESGQNFVLTQLKLKLEFKLSSNPKHFGQFI